MSTTTTPLASPLPKIEAPMPETASSNSSPGLLNPSDTFGHRHIGPNDSEVAEMLEVLGYRSLAELTNATIPASIRLKKPMQLTGLPDQPKGEFELLTELRAIAAQNKVCRSFIGMGYYDTITPPVILRNVMENPGWYTQYTPYQAEIAQGRLEALLNFQTMVSDLTGLSLAGASLLDEATAAAEAMAMCFSVSDHEKKIFYVDPACHPQTIAVCQTRAKSLGIDLTDSGISRSKPTARLPQACGCLVQYPGDRWAESATSRSWPTRCHRRRAWLWPRPICSRSHS